jgi:hypothetical protein
VSIPDLDPDELGAQNVQREREAWRTPDHKYGVRIPPDEGDANYRPRCICLVGMFDPTCPACCHTPALDTHDGPCTCDWRGDAPPPHREWCLAAMLAVQKPQAPASAPNTPPLVSPAEDGSEALRAADVSGLYERDPEFEKVDFDPLHPLNDAENAELNGVLQRLARHRNSPGRRPVVSAYRDGVGMIASERRRVLAGSYDIQHDIKHGTPHLAEQVTDRLDRIDDDPSPLAVEDEIRLWVEIGQFALAAIDVLTVSLLARPDVDNNASSRCVNRESDEPATTREVPLFSADARAELTARADEIGRQAPDAIEDQCPCADHCAGEQT